MAAKRPCRMILCACALGIPLVLTAAEIERASAYATSAQSALAALIVESLDANPRLLAARAAVDAAQARARAAQQPLYNPELALDLEHAEADTGALGINQTVDWGGKREARAEVAGFEVAAARARLARARQKLAETLLASLARYQTSRALADLARRRTGLMRRLSVVSRQRSQAGDLNRVDLELARLAYAQARLRQAQAIGNVIEARQALTAVASETNRHWPDLPGELPMLKAHDVDLEALVNELPAIRLHRARMEAARGTVALSERSRRPDPTFGLRGGREESDTLVGISLSLPLFVRNDFSAEVQAANAELIQAQSEAQLAYHRARARLLAALAQYRVTQRAGRAWQRIGQQSLSMQIDLLKRLWQAGELPTTSYLVQLNQALDTQASALELRGRSWRAWFEWLAASARMQAWLGLRAR